MQIYKKNQRLMVTNKEAKQHILVLTPLNSDIFQICHHTQIMFSNSFYYHDKSRDFQGDRGVRGQKMMFDYFWRSQWAWITAFYIIAKFDSVQKLSRFQFREFGKISHKFPDKNSILGYVCLFVSAILNQNCRAWIVLREIS